MEEAREHGVDGRMKKLTTLLGLLVLASSCASTQPVSFKTAVAPAESHANANFTVIELSHASAPELRDILVQLIQSSEKQRANGVLHPPGTTPQPVAPRPTPSIVADSRTNSLIVSWFDDADLAAVRDLIARLDVEVVPAKK
jgi:type II secretory pathway component GspD/PulD (secretin)